MLLLVVDDNLLSCTRLLAQARAAGWQATAAGPGPEGLTLARQRRPDAIVVNLAASAHEPALFVRALKAEPDLAPIPVIGFCAHRDRMRRQGAAAAGCDRVVTNSSVARHLPTLLAGLAARGAP